MRIVIATGIFPPDIGGPATHARDVAEILRARGNNVRVVTFRDEPTLDRSPSEIRFPRSWPWPIRHAAVVLWFIWRRHRYDVVYATGLYTAAVTGAKLAGRPVVVKIVGDPAWERGTRLGLTRATFEDFQHTRKRGLRLRLMTAARHLDVALADRVVVPSHYLARIVRGWLKGSSDPTVIYNGVRTVQPPAGRPPRQVLCTIFVGRLLPHKRVDILIDAVSRAEPAVKLTIIGDGPAYDDLRGRAEALGAVDRVSFLGPLPHKDTMDHLAASDVLVLASEYEGLPHVILEALAVGVPVVSADVGGVTEVVSHSRNGLIVSPADAAHFGRALSTLAGDVGYRDKLLAQVQREAGRWRIDANVRRLEAVLAEVCG